MTEYVIEQSGSVLIGPMPWRRNEVQVAAGLRGNANPPPVPYDCGDDKTLREVKRDRSALTGERWEQERIKSQGVAEDGSWAIVFEPVNPDATALDGVRDELQADVDRMAESIRARYATTIWGQETVYLEKEAEAKAYNADGSLPEADTPYLTAEASASDSDRATIAAEILTNSAAWRSLSVAIEARRMGLKRTIQSANLEGLRSIDVSEGWPV